jgi:ATP-dependent Clp protease ATP-binding subunit ClpC
MFKEETTKLADQDKALTAVQRLVCSTCSGVGCQACDRMGQGSWLHERFVYFRYGLTRALISLHRAQRKFYHALDIVTYIISVLGVLSLLFWVYIQFQDLRGLADLIFWTKRSLWLFWFWLSIAVDLFIIYRNSQKADRKQRIVQKKYVNQAQNQNLPTDWIGLKSYKKKINALSGCSDQTLDILAHAFALAAKFKHAHVQAVHIFAVLSATDFETVGIFGRLNVNQDILLKKINNQLNRLPKATHRPTFTSEAKQVLISAYLDSYHAGQIEIRTIDLLVPCTQTDKMLSEILYDLEIDFDKLNNTVAWFRINETMLRNYAEYKKAARFKPSTNMNRAYTAIATPLLDSLSYDLTLAAKYNKLDICVAREHEIAEIFEALESGQSASLLVGPPGVGRNTIIGGIAQLMAAEQVPKMLRDKRLVELDAARLVGGATPAEAQSRMLEALNEAASSGNIVIYIKDIENITGISSGTGESLDLAEILVNFLERSNLYAFATVSDQNYVKYIENTPLGRAMPKVEVAEPEPNQAIQMIESKVSLFEGHYHVYYSYDALEQAVRLSSKYMHDRYLPDKAIDILKTAAVEASRGGKGNNVVSGDAVASVISEETKIPVTKVGQNEGKSLLNLEAKIHERMIGQDLAVKMVSSALRRARVELREGKRPIANFLFLGPTGVGKTELAKTISNVYFGAEEYMIRIDMSEYQHQDSIIKMIGAPDGTLGYLTEAVRKAPFSLILLDEIEKANPQIMNLFLQVMDDGRLTDGQGRTIDFTNSIIIATSNIGALYIQEQVRKQVELESIRQDIINDYLSQQMRPELINRFDGIIIFKPLTIEEVILIAKLMLGKLKQALEVKGIAMEISEAGARVLAEQGYEPEYGARPLRRLIQDTIENEIANKLLGGEIVRRDTVLINDLAKVEIRKGREL